MSEKIKLRIHLPTKVIEEEYDINVTAEEIRNKYISEFPLEVVGAKINNLVKELTYKITKPADISFCDVTSLDGNKIYQRSLSFVYVRAVKEVLGNCNVLIEHSLSKGLFTSIRDDGEITEEKVKQIENRMRELIAEDIPFVRKTVSITEAIKIFEEQGMKEKVKIMKYKKDDTVNIYSCGWISNYFFGYMVPSTGFLYSFGLMKYKDGIIVRFPHMSNPTELPEFVEHPKISEIFKESEAWGKIIDVSYVADLNEHVEAGESGEVIRVAEALHEKKVAEIADLILKEKKRIVLIAGPSSSGKTTFANRLSIQLRVNGLKPKAISTDNYFVERGQTPKDGNGEYDFECLEAVDTKLFNKQIKELLEGKEVDMPVFDFVEGVKQFGMNKVKIEDDQILVIEGIHSLNNKLTEEIPMDNKFKIYISPLTQLNIDDHNRIPTTDTRLLRRMIRDNNFRGNPASTTLKQWKSVRAGEEKNIFPYQEEADIMFNSAIVYELAVLKKYAEPLLNEISQDDEYYSEARRLLKFLGYFVSIDDESAILNNSIIKEFIGNGCFC